MTTRGTGAEMPDFVEPFNGVPALVTRLFEIVMNEPPKTEMP